METDQRSTQRIVLVRIVTFRENGRDYKHAEIAQAVRDQVAEVPGLQVDVIVATTPAEVQAALSVPANVVVVLGHSGWAGERWTDLLSTPRADLHNLIHADAAVFAGCWLAGEPVGVSRILVKPTPALACHKRTEFDQSEQFLPLLLAELAHDDQTRAWADRLTSALAMARTQVARSNPKARWPHEWVVL